MWCMRGNMKMSIWPWTAGKDKGSKEAKGKHSSVPQREYRNVFAELGKSRDEIQAHLDEVVSHFFEGEERLFHLVEPDMAYIEDTGNLDVRTEGMSYGLMMCVQLDRKADFDRLWKWVKTYMYQPEGWQEGYFAWSCKTTGEKNDDGPASDGEEFFAMALFFASHRWGDGEGIFDYSREAKAILRACLHKGQDGRPGTPMWNLENHQILFVPGLQFTDPSYHVPVFYELFAKWADEEDTEFWAEAARVSREFWLVACHPKTGLCPEYSEFDGSPLRQSFSWMGNRHDWFSSDSYRTAANIGLDYEWAKTDVGQSEIIKRLLRFFGIQNKEKPYAVYETDGTPIEGTDYGPWVTGILATTAQGVLALPGPLSSDSSEEVQRLAAEWVESFWERPMGTGKWRYYGNCLHVLAFLALSGNYRIWE